jgi:hypothetical protein
MRLAAFCIALGALVPSVTLAARGVSCHCYRDRAYDPEAPAAADGYLLAASRSSLVSAALGPSKRSLVAAVMSGTAPDDLLVAHWVAAKAHRFPSELLDAKAAKRTWKAALEGVGPKDVGAAFGAALQRNATAAELAAIAVDELLVTRVGVDAAVLRDVRGTGASTDETILAVVLAAARGGSAMSALARVKTGEATWGALLHAAGIEGDALDGVVREVVR